VKPELYFFCSLSGVRAVLIAKWFVLCKLGFKVAQCFAFSFRPSEGGL
jgi:hypothetical protein